MHGLDLLIGWSSIFLITKLQIFCIDLELQSNSDYLLLPIGGAHCILFIVFKSNPVQPVPPSGGCRQVECYVNADLDLCNRKMEPHPLERYFINCLSLLDLSLTWWKVLIHVMVHSYSCNWMDGRPQLCSSVAGDPCPTLQTHNSPIE